MSENYSPEIEDVILNLLRETFGDNFKEYYFDDPGYIPKSKLPCITVESLSTGVALAATGMDNRTFRVRVKIIFDKTKEFKKRPDEKAAARTIKRTIEGIDADTGEYMPKSIFGILRTKFTLSQNSQGQMLEAEYGDGLRDNNVTKEGWVTADIESLITVSNRT